MSLERLLSERAARDGGRLFVSLAYRSDGRWQAAHRGVGDGFNIVVDDDPLDALRRALGAVEDDDDPLATLL